MGAELYGLQTEKMKNLFFRIFGSKRSLKGEDTFDSVLGPLVYSEGGWWEATVTIGESKIGFSIGGETKPDLGLIDHAHEIVANFDAFSRMIGEFRSKAAEGLPPEAASEINQLKIDHIILRQPTRPDDGMIFFTGPDEYHIWHCDYIQRKPDWLTFDS